jgi:ssDNA-binding Zn-finger/Zn-ribbon topoisomerase 1
MSEIKCPDCGAPMVLRSTNKYKYKDGSPRKFYGCSTFPKCRGTHGAHPDGSLLGTPGDSKTKISRMAAHESFDRLWKNNHMERGYAYEWLAIQMRISVEHCHIGNFNEEQCQQVTNLCDDYIGMKG